MAARRPSKFVRWLAVLLIAAACGPCSCCATLGPSPDLEPADLIGTWRHERGGWVTIREDGTFTAEKLDVCESLGGSGTGDGAWSIEEPSFLSAIQHFTLDFDRSDPVDMFVYWPAGDEIDYYIGDPDSVDLCRFYRDED